MLTNRILSASEAEQWGLINRAVAADALVEETHQLIAQLCQGPTRALGAVKSLLNDSFNQGLETQMEHETRAIAECAMSRDGREGVRAFLEKRQPDFQGH